MQGDLLAASHNDAVYRIRLTPDGTAVESSTVLFSSAAQLPLDVTAVGDAGPFPGLDLAGRLPGRRHRGVRAVVGRLHGHRRPGAGRGRRRVRQRRRDRQRAPARARRPTTRPTPTATTTPTSLDPDDDNDGLPDTADPFAVDPANGRGTPLPVTLTWDNDAPPAGGLLGLGFTGLMADGTTDYAARFDPGRMTAGGAAGVVTIDEVGDGTRGGRGEHPARRVPARRRRDHGLRPVRRAHPPAGPVRRRRRGRGRRTACSWGRATRTTTSP